MAKSKKSSDSYFDKIETDIKSNQSTLSLVLGALIILVVGILIFNYFNKPKETVGPAQNTTEEGDVSPDKLPGKYTIKEGDTLFTIAEKYYQDGSKYSELVKTNNLANENMIEVGQVIDIPKLEATESISPTVTEATGEASPTPIESVPTDVPTTAPTAFPTVILTAPVPTVTNTTDWGTPITADQYTVVEGDWLSTIAARAYGDVLAYDKIAKANNITNPDIITPGMVLKLPR